MIAQNSPDLGRAAAVATALANSDDSSHPAAHAGELQQIFGLGGSPATDAHGTIDTRVTVLVLPVEQVRKLLPAGLELAPQPVVPCGWHPVYVLCSHDNFSAWFGDMDYEEMMLAVPYVQISEPRDRYPGPYIYMPRLYLNDAVPRELGVHLYGWEKQAATITSVDHGDDNTYTVTQAGAAPALVGQFHALGAAQAPAAYANFTIVRQLLEQPTISQALHIVDPDASSLKFSGPLLSTTVLYQVDQPGTTIQPITSELTIGASLTPAGIPPGTYRSASLQDSPLGAFRLRCKQFVTLPRSCKDVTFPRPPALRRLKVAVLGGGPAACTAALYLARQTDRYEVSLYTTGFRLGGKCQSWRNPDKAWRIEEHGLHAFLGFYHNAFTAVQDAYTSAYPDDGLGEALYRQAFHAEPYNGVMVRRDGAWSYCPTPGGKGSTKAPGTANLRPGHGLQLALEGALARAVDHLEAMGHEHRLLGAALAEIRQKLEQAAARVRSDAGAATTRRAGTSKELLGGVVIDALIGIRDAVAALVKRLDPLLSTYAWFLWTGFDTMLTIVIGLLRRPVRNLSELDDEDFRDWLRAHGLAETGDERWAVIDQVYETMFAHQPAPAGRQPCAPIDGGAVAARMACGVAMRWFLLEAFGDNGSPSYRFRYSCAQTIMTPMLVALRRLGAKVHFFHTVNKLELAGSGADRRITAVHLERQAEVRAGSDAYDPLIKRDLPNNPAELRDWPMDPDYEQLVDGAWYREHGIDFFNAWQTGNDHARPVELRQGVDFDLAILGVPLGALPLIDSPLTSPSRADADPIWKAMIDGIAVTQTMSFQLWLNTPSSSLLAAPRGLLTTYAQPEPSYGDFTPLVTYEDWPDPRPQYVAYFTGASYSGKPPLPPQCGADYPERMQKAWTGLVYEWLRDNYAAFYDGPATPRAFPGFLGLLSVLGDMPLDQRLAWQHIIADVQPSNLYVLSQPRATALRLGQAESGVTGLILTGDWTRTDLNCGCVEAATSSGMLAARAISNEPANVWRPGF